MSDVKDSIEAVPVADDVSFVCVWAWATDPGLIDQSKARKLIAMRMQMLIFLPKARAFA